MSLILDALKKTESSKDKTETQLESQEEITGSSTGTFNPQPETNNTAKAPFLDNTKKRILLFAGLALLGFGIIIYIAFSRGLTALFQFGKSNTPQVSSTITVKKTPLTNPIDEKKKKDQEVINLKKEAIALYQSSKYLESSEVYKKLVNILPANPEIYNNYGLSLKKAGKTSEAKQVYQIALALNENYPEGLNNLATIEISEQKYNEAKRHLEKALEIKSNYIDAHLHLAICLEKMGDLYDAITHYQNFLDYSEGKVSRTIRLQVENRLSTLRDELVAK